jgi:FAD binding domain
VGVTRHRLFPVRGNLSTDDVPELTLVSLQTMLEEWSGRTDIYLHDLNWISLYWINFRMVDRFRVGRVFLAGDAAHVHSSAGGQGLNTGVQDAYNLGWKLGAVLAGAPEELLDTYEAERLPIAADLLSITTMWHYQDFRPSTGQQCGSSPDLYQLTLNYRGGPLAGTRGTQRSIQAGDRAPDAPCQDATGAPVHLFDAFRGSHFTLLAFGHSNAATVTELNKQYTTSVHAYAVVCRGERMDSVSIIDTDRHAHRSYAIDPTSQTGALVLIRPDGYLGLYDAGSIHQVHDYLRHVVAG